MKFWKTCLILLLFLILGTTTVNAAQLPLEMIAEYSESQQEILITVIAKEPIVLNAFTFSVTYNMDVYKLYKGNDCVENGYGYVSSFQTVYQKDGMILCNINENQVLFSGVNTESNRMYQGPIAQVSLLKYNKEVETNVSSDVGFEVTALCLNGETIQIEEEEKQIPSVIQPVEQIVYDKEQVPEVSASDETQVQAEESSAPIPSESISASVQPSTGANGIAHKEEQENLPTSLAAVSEGAVLTSGESVLQRESTLTEKETSKTASKEKPQVPQKNSSQWVWLAVAAGGVILVAWLLWIYYKKKPNKTRS